MAEIYLAWRLMMSKLVPKLRFKEFSGEWDKKPINKILTIGSGRDYKHLSDGNIPVYGTGGYMLSVNDYLYDGESVCVGRKGTIDKPMFLTGKFWTVDTLFYTHSFKDNIPKFIYALFLKINWYKYNEASGVPSLSKITIGKIDIYIPTPKEQQKIANTLSSLDNLIEAQQRKVEALQKHKKGLMQQLFPSEGANEPKLRFKEFSGEWEEKKLGDICKVAKSGGTPTSTKSNYYNGTIPFLSIGDMTEQGKYLTNTTKTITQEGLDNSSSWIVPINTIIYSMYASVGFVSINKIPLATSQAVINLVIKDNINIEYIYYFLVNYKKYIHKLIETGTQGNLNAKSVKSIKVLLPILKEQQKIANTLSSLDSLIEAYQRKVEALKKHKKGLMQQMFVSGED